MPIAWVNMAIDIRCFGGRRWFSGDRLLVLLGGGSGCAVYAKLHSGKVVRVKSSDMGQLSYKEADLSSAFSPSMPFVYNITLQHPNASSAFVQLLI